MRLLLLGLLVSSFTVSAETSYDKKLADYVKARIDSRISNGSKAPGLRDLVSKKIDVELEVNKESIRCMGYDSPDRNGKAIGTCLVTTFDKESNGEHLEVTFAVIISVDIEHPGVSRIWQVEVQQLIYF